MPRPSFGGHAICCIDISMSLIENATTAICLPCPLTARSALLAVLIYQRVMFMQGIGVRNWILPPHNLDWEVLTLAWQTSVARASVHDVCPEGQAHGTRLFGHVLDRFLRERECTILRARACARHSARRRRLNSSPGLHGVWQSDTLQQLGMRHPRALDSAHKSGLGP